MNIILFIILLLVLLALACGLSAASTNSPTLQNRNLDQLADRPHILAIVVNDLITSSSDDSGIHYLDVAANQSYIAMPQRRTFNNQEYIWLPERSIWTGNALVYLHRLHGVFALQSDGNVVQLSEVGILGRLSRDGQRILTFKQCGDDTGRRDGFNLITLDELNAGEAGQQLICLNRESGNSAEPWFVASPLWNPDLALAEFFLLQTAYGVGNSLRIESKNVVRLEPDGSFTTLYELGPDYESTTLGLKEAYSGLHPENQMLVFRVGRDLVQFDRDGQIVARLTYTDAEAIVGPMVPPPNPRHFGFGALAWSDDGQQFAAVVRDCTNPSTPRRNCGFHLLTMNPQFEQVRLVASFEAQNNFGFREILWSPDGSYIAALGRDETDKDSIWIIEVATGDVTKFTLSPRPGTDVLLEAMHWVR